MGGRASKMRLDRLTNKMREALQAAQNRALELGNPELTSEHLLWAVLEQQEGLARPILEKSGVDVANLQQKVNARVDGFPKVSGGADAALARSLRGVLTQVWQETQALKDEYSSVEHLLLAWLKEGDTVG